MFKKRLAILCISILFPFVCHAGNPCLVNSDVTKLKEKVDSIRSAVSYIDLKLTDLDKETMQQEVSEHYGSKSSDFLVINKIFFGLVLLFCVGLGVFIRSIFQARYKN